MQKKHGSGTSPPGHGHGSNLVGILDPKLTFEAGGLQKGHRIADIGAGSGRFALIAARIVGPKGKVFAVDISQNAISGLKAEAKRLGIFNIESLVGDATQLPVPDSFVDFCLMANVFHDLVVDGIIEGALEEVKRILVPGGQFLVVEFDKDAPRPPGPPNEIRLEPEEVTEISAKSGLTMPINGKAFRVGNIHYLLRFKNDRKSGKNL